MLLAALVRKRGLEADELPCARDHDRTAGLGLGLLAQERLLCRRLLSLPQLTVFAAAAIDLGVDHRFIPNPLAWYAGANTR